MDTKFMLDDSKELLDQASTTQGEEVYSVIKKLSTKIDNLTLKVQDEFLANQMASKADFG